MGVAVPELSAWISLDRASSTPLVQQLVTQLRACVLRGTLQAGEALPSSRTLAQELAVSRSVVVRAYEQLNGEGYLDSTPGAATRIAAGIVLPDPAAAAAPDTPAPRPATAPAPTPSTAAASIDLRTGYPFAPAAVPVEWRRALQAAAREPLRSREPPALGDPRLRAQIAVHAGRSRGMRCTAADVIVTSGTVDALLLISLALGRHPSWGVEDPGYPDAAQLLELAGAQLHPIAVAAQGVQMRDLTGHALDALLVTPSHQFPLGGQMPAAERTTLVAWALERGTLLVEDDYDSEFRHLGAALPAIAALDHGGTVAHVGSLNKSFSPSLRCGYVITAEGSSIWQALVAAKHIIGSNVPAVVQSATASFFASGAFRRYVARTRREYRHRRALLLDTFARAGLSDHLSGTAGGLHAMLQLPRGHSALEVAQQLAAQGVLVDPITKYTRLGGADNALAIGYGAESVIRLLRGLDRIITAVQADPVPAAAAAAGSSGHRLG